MNALEIIATYSARILCREWRRFVLPFASLIVTGVVLMLILLLTNAGELLLKEQAREILGGDVVVESPSPIDATTFWEKAQLLPDRVSEQISFSGTLRAGEATAPFAIRAVDAAYPLYGAFVLQGSERYRDPGTDGLYLDEAGARRLGVVRGDTVRFGSADYIVRGIILSEPTSLFGGFRFFPQAIMGVSGFGRAQVEPGLLRAEYILAASLPSLSEEEQATLRIIAEESGLDIDLPGSGQRGLQFGLDVVSDFLIIAVLITAVLSAVNVYASTLYLVTVERKSLAIFLALGMRKRTLIAMLGTALAVVVLLAGVLGVLMGVGVFMVVANLLATRLFLELPTPPLFVYGILTLLLLTTTALGAFVPAMRRIIALSPKRALSGIDDEALRRTSPKTLLFITLSTLLPLLFLAVFLFGNIRDGALVMFGILGVYLVVGALFSSVLHFLYKRRARFGFFVRNIISHKKLDGLFGIVSFTSLFVALTALSTLVLLQVALERYLVNDLARTVPTTYVIDIQPSQKDALSARFPDVTLFANTPARIVDIDGVRIQDELAAESATVDRELGREFNLTARTTLLASETLVAGEFSGTRRGEISVDREFAERANIHLGSRVGFLVQGFPVSGVVTSMRDTDSRSGLPFFYFVLHPDDLAQFPGIYFGYAYYDIPVQGELGRFLAATMPNVSMIETQAIGPLLLRIVGLLLSLVLVVTIPPLLIATLLIATLIVSSYTSRRKEGARLRAIGATRGFVLRAYLSESVALTALAAGLAYVLSTVIAYGVSMYFLDLDLFALFDMELLSGVGIVLLFVTGIGLFLFMRDTMPLRELLAHEADR
jgi:putative ABC transport system permease protein